MIPGRVIKEIEYTLMVFLWSGTKLRQNCAKVSWNMTCSLTGEGVLGFRRLKEWNTAAVMRHLWDLCRKADVLWVKWDSH